jgi:hypothetical protein
VRRRRPHIFELLLQLVLLKTSRTVSPGNVLLKNSIFVLGSAFLNLKTSGSCEVTSYMQISSNLQEFESTGSWGVLRTRLV